MTTGGGKVRFNPNLYANGRVCLSILGTWSGPQWTPAMNLYSVVLSIQSLLNKNPFYNEPGFKKQLALEQASKKYNDSVVLNTMEVAVYGMVTDSYGDANGMPKRLREHVQTSFVNSYDQFMVTIEAKMTEDKKAYTMLKQKFINLKAQIDGGKKFY